MTNVKLSVRNTASCIQAQSCPDSGTQPQTSVSNGRRRLGLRLLPWLRFCPRWHAVASWTWDAQDETCGICRMAFDGCCPDCKLPGDDCPLIWGACNHAFHLHCILKWVNSQTSQAHCPMCRREWQFKG
ncbi:PREDICTED: anaphase-promoting complex subunit 11-like [Prunus mume]|uniref:Anaphase-promoting complex subunit 11 n=1 Tax=Prunus mume TaxID=102107 RepID=A0ABM1LK79_PRUMU|nr:PREDICTED: anaphase-promoting complex subunit 11-like [Prunus mume]